MGWSQDVPKTVPRLFWDYLGLPEKIRIDDKTTFPVPDWDYLGMRWDYPETILRLSWDYLGMRWEYRKVSVTRTYSHWDYLGMSGTIGGFT